MRIPTRRGVGDVLNPAAGTSLNCGLLAGGLFNPTCWCAQFPTLCLNSPTATVQDVANAAAGVSNPQIYLPTVAPTPGAVSAGESTVPAPYTLAQYNDAYYQALQAGQTTADVANQSIMEQTAANIAAAGAAGATPPTPPTTDNTWLYVAAAVGIGLLLFLKK
jgi:hypothetical protein